MASKAPFRRALIVGADSVDLREVGEHLAHHNYQCELARNSSEALDQVEDGVFDFVVVDTRLCGFSAFELVRELRRMRPAMHVALAAGDSDDLSPLEDRDGHTMVPVLNRNLQSSAIADFMLQTLPTQIAAD